MNTYMRSLFLERMEQEATEEEIAEAYRVVALNEGLVSESDTHKALADACRELEASGRWTHVFASGA